MPATRVPDTTVNTEPRGNPSVLVFAGDPDEAAAAADALEDVDAAPAPISDIGPQSPVGDALQTPGDGDLAATNAAVVLDAEGLDAVRDRDRSWHVVAFVDDPAAEPATDSLIDAIATRPGDLNATLRWLVARDEAGRDRDQEALRAERDRLLALFSNVPDPAIAYDYVDGEPIVHRVNDAFEETFGYDADRVVGESVDDFIVPPTDDAESEAEELNERLQRGENVRREVTRKTVDGPRHFILHVVPIRLDAENVSGYAIYTDVTERREREAALERQNERLDEFASIVSHDLRNPLSVAEGYVTLAHETGETDYLEKATEALDRMDELVEDLLTLARQGDSVGETAPVSLGALARDAWESVDTGDAELVVDGDMTIDANPTRTRELLENVFRNSVEHGRARDSTAVSRDDENSGTEFSNHSTCSRAPPDDSAEHGRSRAGDTASRDDEHSVSECSSRSTSNRTSSGDSVDHSPVAPGDNGEHLTVRVGEAAFRGDGGASSRGFFVEDDGRGLPESDRDRVFESGFTTEENGTGLGLAITKRIADAHGWEVRALGSESGGARFEFKTP